MDNPLLLEVKDLEASFMTREGEVQAIRGVSFSLRQGETLSIVGESGCGKSVTVQTVMRLNPEPPLVIKKGSIKFQGEELINKTNKEMREYRGKAFSMIFQDAMTSLNPTMRIGKQIVEAIRVHRNISRAEAKVEAAGLFRQVGLPNPEKAGRLFPHTLSGGMRQRAMIAMALCCNPAILIADEPTTALDVTTQAQILELMREIKVKRGAGIILITHDLGAVTRMGGSIAVMYAGRIVESGSSGDIFYRPSHPYTWGLLGSRPNLIQERKPLMSIPGTPPDLFAPPPGCAFAPRCLYCMGACVKEQPPEFTVGDGHTANCWLLDRRAKNIPVPPVGRAARLKGKGEVL
jgi:oligopeptide transport system ATP-binding protein